MREKTIYGDICLKDEYGFVYRVAGIRYTEREDESFLYEFRPNYSVINLLTSKDFQGIPGLDLDLKKECYLRENVIPVFISERAPMKNREDLWELLDKNHMDYLNQLEWLIKTDTQYPGDKLFVQKAQEKALEVVSLKELGNRSAVICRKILEVICYGGTILSQEVRIDDENRKVFYDLLFSLYCTERKFLDTQRRLGIAESAKKGKYKGRKRIPVDTLQAAEVFHRYQNGEMNSTDASCALGISKPTFLRRYREYLQLHQ